MLKIDVKNMDFVNINLGSQLVYTMSMSFRCIYVRHQHSTTFNENGQDLFMIFETPNQSIKNLNVHEIRY